MRIPVLIEPVNGKFQARCGEPFVLSAEGTTEEEALGELRALLMQHTATATVVELELPSDPPPWASCFGILKDDPLQDEWEQAMQEYRNQVEQDPNY